MVIMTAKLSKSKLIAIALLLVIVIVIAVICLSHASSPAEPETQTETAVPAQNAGTNEGRIAFLSAFGWEVTDQPVQTFP